MLTALQFRIWGIGFAWGVCVRVLGLEVGVRGINGGGVTDTQPAPAMIAPRQAPALPPPPPPR